MPVSSDCASSRVGLSPGKADPVRIEDPQSRADQQQNGLVERAWYGQQAQSSSAA